MGVCEWVRGACARMMCQTHVLELVLRHKDNGDVCITEDKVDSRGAECVVERDARAALAPDGKERLHPLDAVDAEDADG
jgi:hypothetical protein